ncbi:hypothetical protein BC937DRAFT_90318 [Endogone sp. FLAS-F59071]|nr:hypothetical protein BC937DRAFT_90318 [Endogone sp. FLAS-F59071]|eukprot:RUS22115.1 hypothetical protein BC937DRAFT_90318 [Endogone sp. FLAS-F59071]
MLLFLLTFPLLLFYFYPVIVKLATHSESITIPKVPRPIAFASTIDQSTGKVNVAPFSFFNALGQDPPTVMISVSRPGGNLKDTGKNVIESKEFVVNIISEWFAE